jgi:hypothetical protein
MGATAAPAGRLASVRRIDWRFLLPAAAFDRVLVVGAADEAVATALRHVAGVVTEAAVDGRRTSLEPDLVVTIAPGATALADALRHVSHGGWIYVGSGPAHRSRKMSPRKVVRAAREAGLTDIRRFWHWPSEPSALEIVPLDEPRAVRMILDRRRSGRAARLKARVADLALRIGLLDLVVPGWSVIARRPDAGETNDAGFRIDQIRAAVPGAEAAAAVLLTPRFLASRHVIALLLDTSHDRLSGVVKLPRLPEDDAGIRGEAAALTRAAELGATGVPRVLALHGAPTPALVESALDGVVIPSAEVRAGSQDLAAEIEAWTLALAGPRDRRRVPLRQLWEPALERVAARLGEVPAAEPAAAGSVGDRRAPQIAGLVRRTAAILEPHGHVPVPVVLEHGDLAPPNLLRLRGGRLGVVDWEVADRDGLPLGDLLFFAAFSSSDESKDDDPRLGVAAAPACAAAIERQAAKLGIGLSLVPVLALAMWARWADRQLGRFRDASTPVDERLPARHVASWEAAVGRLEAGS